MNPVRSRALRLRILGKSYNEISSELAIPKSTLSGWFRDLVLSDAAQARLASRTCLGTEILIKRNKMQTHRAEQRAHEMRAFAKAEIPALTERDLLVIGPVLYWAEGYKRLKIREGRERVGHTIRFVNSDADMIAVFVRFLLDVLSITPEKIRLTMRLYGHINEEEARKYWMHATGLPRDQFFKTSLSISGASKGIRPYNRLPYGTLEVEVCDTAKFHYLMGMIEGVKERLIRDRISPLPG